MGSRRTDRYLRGAAGVGDGHPWVAEKGVHVQMAALQGVPFGHAVDESGNRVDSLAYTVVVPNHALLGPQEGFPDGGRAQGCERLETS